MTMGSMDERPLHEQVEAVKDDHVAWGEVVPAPERKSRSERRQRGAVVSVRLTDEELELLQAYADSRGMALSAALREQALDAARRPDQSEGQATEVEYLHPRRRRNTMTYTAQRGAPLVPAGDASSVAE